MHQIHWKPLPFCVYVCMYVNKVYIYHQPDVVPASDPDARESEKEES